MANPVLRRAEEYAKFDQGTNGVMTASGALTNFAILSVIMLLPAILCWNWVALNYMDKVIIAAQGGAIVGFILGLIICFKPKTAPILSPIYAACEGLFLGGVSAIFEKYYPGIVIQAVSATMLTAFSMFFLFKTGLIRATERFRSVVITATLSIALLYFLSWLLRLFGNAAISNFLWSSTSASILVSVVVCIVAALNLIIDFDNIRIFEEHGAPKFMESYCGFALLVTIVWLYIELLKLFAKTRRR